MLLDPDDEEFVKSYFWFLHPRGVMTSVGKTAYFMLARVLVKAEHDECVIFKNKDCNDCRKENLLRVTRKQISAMSPKHGPRLNGGIRMVNYKDRHGKPRQKVVAEACHNRVRKTCTFEVNKYGEMEAKLLAAGWRIENLPPDFRQRVEEDLRPDIEESPLGLDEDGMPVAVTGFDYDAVDILANTSVSYDRPQGGN